VEPSKAKRSDLTFRLRAFLRRRNVRRFPMRTVTPLGTLALVAVMTLGALVLSTTPAGADGVSCATYQQLPHCEVGNQPIVAVSSSTEPFVYAITSTGSVYGSYEVWPGMNGQRLSAPIVGIAATSLGATSPENPVGNSYPYWLVASDGGVFAFAGPSYSGPPSSPPSPGGRFYGSMGGAHLNAPVVGIAATPDGGGYWLVAADGGVFSFGDAQFFGSMGGTRMNSRIVGIAATHDGGGYWLVAADGGVFAFGDAQFFGSTGGAPLNAPIVGMTVTPDGGGYVLAAADGGIFDFGDAAFVGSAVGLVDGPVVGVSMSQYNGLSVTTSLGMTLNLGQ
jgi:hypothetical protein